MKKPPGGFDRRLKVTLLWSLRELRLDDAQTLFETEQHSRRNGSIYLAGYAVECALKAKICERRGKTVFDPDAEFKKFKIHTLKLLAERGGLNDIIGGNATMASALLFLDNRWSVVLRYSNRSISNEEVREFLDKARGFTQWLRAQ